MSPFLRFFTSIRLAIVLIAWLALAGMAASLVPQGLEAGDYARAYGDLLGPLITASGLGHIPSSALFLIPSFLFIANLAACSLSRLLRELRRAGRRRHGPDILHLGLLLLAIGALLSFGGRREGAVFLAAGEAARLPDGSLLRLASFEFLRHPDGRPKDWISRVDVERGGKRLVEGFELRVNHPLKVGSWSVYQVSHDSERLIRLVEGSGEEGLLRPGEKLFSAGSGLAYVGQRQGQPILRLEEDGAAARELPVGAGDLLGPWRVLGIEELPLSALKAVSDPGFPLVIGAFAIILLGLALTFLGALGEKKP